MVKSPKRFYKILDTTERQISYISDNIEKFYLIEEKPKLDGQGNPKLKNGIPEVRILNPSIGKLKSIQKLIVSRIFSEIELPKCLHGSIKKRSTISYAKTHQGNKYFFLTDLRNFFPSITFPIVFESLRREGYTPFIANLITRLTTFNKSLPQGAPTSPFLANLAFLPFDYELLNLCEINGMNYTRYIDDLTISSKKEISKVLVDQILSVIKKSPFQYHNRKTKLKSGVIETTGIIIKNNGLDVPESKYTKLELLDPQSDSAIGLKNYIDLVKDS